MPVGLVLVRVEHLELVRALQEHAAVPALLAFALHFGGCRPLDVQLDVAEAALRPDAARASLDGGDAIGNGPERGTAALLVLPLRQVLAVEQHDGIGRRGAERRSRGHDAWGRLRRGYFV